MLVKIDPGSKETGIASGAGRRKEAPPRTRVLRRGAPGSRHPRRHGCTQRLAPPQTVGQPALSSPAVQQPPSAREVAPAISAAPGGFDPFVGCTPPPAGSGERPCRGSREVRCPEAPEPGNLRDGVSAGHALFLRRARVPLRRNSGASASTAARRTSRSTSTTWSRGRRAVPTVFQSGSGLHLLQPEEGRAKPSRPSSRAGQMCSHG